MAGNRKVQNYHNAGDNKWFTLEVEESAAMAHVGTRDLMEPCSATGCAAVCNSQPCINDYLYDDPAGECVCLPGSLHKDQCEDVAGSICVEDNCTCRPGFVVTESVLKRAFLRPGC